MNRNARLNKARMNDQGHTGYAMGGLNGVQSVTKAGMKPSMKPRMGVVSKSGQNSVSKGVKAPNPTSRDPRQSGGGL